MRKYKVTRKKQVTIALSGTSGTANVNINGTNYLVTFGTSLTVTADSFRTTHAANILAQQGVVVTDNDAGSIVLKANVSGKLFTASITNATGDLAGAITQNAAQANYEVFTSGLKAAGGGNVCVFQIKNSDNDQLLVEAEKIKKINYHEGELFTIADTENFTLIATDDDGANATTIHTES